MTPPTNPKYPNGPDGLPKEALEWLDEHPDLKAEDLEEAWRLAELARPTGASYEPGADRVTAMRTAILDEIAALPQGAKRPTRMWTIGRVWAVAASVLIAAAIATLLLWKPLTVTAPVGGLREVALSDGSNVLLNSGSALTYSRGFGWFGRSVELRGEAFFNVAKGSASFEVKTFNGIVTVLGTRFNVRAWPDEDGMETRVILAEGTVAFSARDAREGSVELHAGQMSRVTGSDRRPTEPLNVEVDRLLAWRSGGLAYSETEIAVVLADLQRRFDVHIEASDEIRKRQVSLYMSHTGDVETVLDVLAGMHGLQWSRKGSRYELHSIADH